MVLYGLFCYNDCNRIGRNAYYKINDKGRLRNERWGILSGSAKNSMETAQNNEVM